MIKFGYKSGNFNSMKFFKQKPVITSSVPCTRLGKFVMGGKLPLKFSYNFDKPFETLRRCHLKSQYWAGMGEISRGG